MKKKFSILSIFAIILCSCLMFFGCGKEPPKYNVKATVWYVNYGSVEGTGTYSENSTCILKATPKQGSTFMAWTKNNLVVSYESTFEFKVTNETSGNYVAIFTLPNLDLVTPKSVEFKSNLQDVSSCNLVLKLGTNYEYLHDMFSGEVANEGQYSFENIVLALPVNNKIICEANLTVTYTTLIEGEETQASANTKTYFEITLEELFADNLQLQIPTGIAGNASIVLNFENFSVQVPEPETPQENA